MKKIERARKENKIKENKLKVENKFKDYYRNLADNIIRSKLFKLNGIFIMSKLYFIYKSLCVILYTVYTIIFINTYLFNILKSKFPFYY